MKVGIIGAGRIGKVHAKNISMFVPEMEIKTIADPFMNEQTEAFAKSCGIPNTTKDANDILNDPEIDAVLICSSTDTHSKYIIEAAHAAGHLLRSRSIMIGEGSRCHQRSQGSRR
ncbi:MAG: Gfo/Idh/MocA family oxidoreductase [Butyricicoccus sp.]